jgi:putative tricarboxylic transport membrane protein
MRANIIWGAILTCGSGFLLWVAYRPVKHGLLDTGVSGMIWPQMILWGLLFLSLLLLARGCVGALNARPERQRDVSSSHFQKPILLALLGAVYFALFDELGFIVSTLLFTASTVLLLGRRRPIEVSLFSLGFTATLLIIFVKALNVPLPRGVGVFREFSLLFY